MFEVSAFMALLTEPLVILSIVICCFMCLIMAEKESRHLL